MNEFLYNAKNVDLNYAMSHNNGSPLLLLHGGSSRWQCFEGIISDLVQKFHVYALDLSSRVKNGYKLQDYVPDVAGFIKNYIKKPAIIFGHSLVGRNFILFTEEEN